ncbi:uncharacterized protein LOC143627821 [Bidens hawaiensis]|uniref:uncharacterized protein LOC143627821 n=1 Tax=Bidens hawaiensis TaxID=980011 RepID=UPI00404A11D3
MMNNILVIVLVLTSLLTCTSLHKDHQEVIVKDRHRVVAVEYDKEADGSTKVSISPPDASDSEKQAHGMFSGPRDLVCDAYGKCKHVFKKTKDAVTKTAHGVTDKAEEIQEALKEAIEKSPQDLAGEGKDKVSEGVREKAKASLAHGVDKAKKLAGGMNEVVKEAVSDDFNVVDSPKRIVEDISTNVTGKYRETVRNVQEAGRKTLNGILYKFRKLMYDVIWCILYRDKIGPLVGLIHMLGFSTAYGMCVWVTFVSSYVLGRCLPRQMFGVVQSRMYPVYFRAMAYCVSAALLGHLLGHKTEFLASKIGLFQSLSLVSALLMVLINIICLEPKATKAMYRRMKLEKEEGKGIGVAVAAKGGMDDCDGVTVARGARVAVDGGGDTVVRSVANGRGVTVAVKDNVMENVAGVAVGTTHGSNASVAARSVAVDRQDVLKLNERLKKLNAYSSALNMFTLVALTWHMAYMGQRLQGYTAK